MLMSLSKAIPRVEIVVEAVQRPRHADRETAAFGSDTIGGGHAVRIPRADGSVNAGKSISRGQVQHLARGPRASGASAARRTRRSSTPGVREGN